MRRPRQPDWFMQRLVPCISMPYMLKPGTMNIRIKKTNNDECVKVVAHPLAITYIEMEDKPSKRHAITSTSLELMTRTKLGRFYKSARKIQTIFVASFSAGWARIVQGWPENICSRGFGSLDSTACGGNGQSAPLIERSMYLRAPIQAAPCT
jgi:hypothetical protein